MFKKKEAKITQETKEKIFNRIRPIIAKELEIDESIITLTSKISDDLGADSLDAIEIVMALEEEFNIEILDKDQEKLKSVEDIVAYLIERIKA